jgi:hypothetical protein
MFSQMVTELDRGRRNPEWVSSTTLFLILAFCFAGGLFAIPAALLNLSYHVHWIRHKTWRTIQRAPSSGISSTPLSHCASSSIP